MELKSDIPIKDEKILDALSDVETKAKEIIGEKLVEIILFGSYARGQNDSESDMDIMMLIDEDEEHIRKLDEQLTEVMFQLSLKHEVLLMVLLKSIREFKKHLNVLPFYMNVRNEGIKIYG